MTGRYSDHPERRAVIDRVAGKRIRHRNEVVGIPLLHVPEIAHRVVVVAVLVGERIERDAPERVRHHAVVLRIDERGVDQLIAAAKFLITELGPPVDLAERADRVLSWRQQLRPVLVEGTEEFLRGVVRCVHPENIVDQTGAKSHPAADRPRLRSRPVRIVACQVVGSGDKLHQGLAEEGRRVVGKLPINLLHIGLRRNFLDGPCEDALDPRSRFDPPAEVARSRLADWHSPFVPG